MAEHTTTPGPAYDAHEAHEEHYSTPAAWTLVSLVMLGSLVLCVGMVIPSNAVMIAGVVVIVAGLITGRVMASRGYGVAGKRSH